MRTNIQSVAALAAWYAGLTSANVLQYSPSDAKDISFSVAVPKAVASSNSGNLYFQIAAPTTYSWVALGTGTQMDKSNIFLMYADGAGNVTMSPRAGTFHTMPMEDTSATAAKLTLLSGSGVSSDGKTMTANVVCSNCQTWGSGQSISLASTSAGWIAAWKAGSPINSKSLSAGIGYHDSRSVFNLDMTQAQIAMDSSPFTQSATTGSNSSGTGTSSSSSSGVTEKSGAPNMNIIAAHGVIMALVMVVLYPLGSILMPVLGKWKVHSAFQWLSVLLMWAGFALGVKFAKDTDSLFIEKHTIFGTVIVCLFMIQPALGILHHQLYVKTGGRTAVSYVHIFYGRAVMLLGIINGGLGLALAEAPNGQIVAYSVVAAGVFVIYVFVKLLATFRHSKRSGEEVESNSGAQKRAEVGGVSPPSTR